MSTPQSPLAKLERTIAARAAKPDQRSYTSQLLTGGVPKIGAKIVEEAAEVVEAADESGDAGREHFIREVGDLMYHLLVLMRHRHCSLADVETELARRFGVSGIAEKASRKKSAEDSGTKPVKKRAAKRAAKTVAPAPKARRKSRL